MVDIQRYQIPDTRLPFVNTEIAQVDVKGIPYLVSSIVGGASSGEANLLLESRHTRAFYATTSCPHKVLHPQINNGDSLVVAGKSLQI